MAEYSLQDTIGQALGLWADVAKNKYATRLEQTRAQAKQYDIPSQPSNPQAKAGSYTATGMLQSVAGNPWAIAAGVALAGFVAWRLMR